MSDNLKQREQELEAEALRINAGRKPKFGDLMRNPWASESNPIRDGYFVRKCGAGFDAYYEFTNGNGKFWKTRARFAFFIEAARATPAQPVPTFEVTEIHGAGRVNQYGDEPHITGHHERSYTIPGQPSPSSVGDAIRAMPLPEPSHGKIAIHGVPYYSEVYLHALLSEAAALAEQVQGQQWISVSDQMPEQLKDVLIWEKYSTSPVVGYHNGREWSASQEHYDTYASYGPGAVVIDKLTQDLITHWMPLPAAPSIAQDGQKPEGT